MRKIIITDNFSTSMLTGVDCTGLLIGVLVEFNLISYRTACSIVYQDDVEVISAVVDTDIAKTVSDFLGIKLTMSETPVKLTYGDSIIVVQSSDAEFPVDEITSPNGTKMYFWEVNLPPWQ